MRLFLLFLFILSQQTFYGSSFSRTYHIDTKDGLSDLTVNAIAQDSLGVLYFGSENGLTIFDGNKFERYFAGTSENTISANSIYSIIVDKSDRVWLGNWKGIDRYDRKTNSFRNYQIGDSKYRVGAIYQDSKSRIWIGAYGLGLCYYDEATDSIKSFKNPLLENSSISSITEDTHGNLWLGTEINGIFLMQSNLDGVLSFESGISGVCKPFSFTNNRIRSLTNYGNGDMIIGTYDKGVFLYNSASQEIKPFPYTTENLNNKSHISRILQDNKKNLWFGIDGGGIVEYIAKEQRAVDIDVATNPLNTIKSKSVRTIFFDKNRTLWVGTYKNGIDFTYQANMKEFHYFQPSSGPKSVTSLSKLDNNKFIIGTDGSGLLIFNTDSKEFTSTKLANCDNILSIYKNRDENFWLGTFTRGLVVVDKNIDIKKDINIGNSAIESNDIRAIVGDKTKIYIGTNGNGLKIYDSEQKDLGSLNYDFLNPMKGIVHFGITTLLLDSRGILWIGTKDGMTIYEPKTKRFVNIKTTPDKRDAECYNCFYEDQRGTIWAGTNRGLIKFNHPCSSESFNASDSVFITNLNIENYLTNDNEISIINSMVEDGLGNIWLGSNQGLIRFNTQTSTEHYYFQEEGVSLAGFNNNSAFKDGQNLYFGGSSGLLIFNPKEVLTNLQPPNVILTALLINMKEISVKERFQNSEVLPCHINFSKNIVIAPGAKIISIGFGSTNSFLSSEIEYSYRMLGLNDEWITVSGDNLTATFSNISAGQYKFQVKARYRHGNLNDSAIRELEIKQLPNFWETLWFKTLVLIALVATIYFSYRRRIQLIKHRTQMLKRMVQEKSAELILERDEKLAALEKERLLLVEKEHAEHERLVLENKIQWELSEKLRLELELKTQMENTINGELSATLIQVTKKNDLLKWLKNELNHLSSASTKDLNSNIAEIIHKIDSEFFFQDDWQKFENHFNVVYSDFIKKMKTTYPELTSKELRLCSYIKMNLSSSEIAQLSNITMRGVEKSRSRLRKKLNLDGTEDIYEYILNIDSPNNAPSTNP